MRPRIVIIMLLAGLAGIVGIFFLNNLVGHPQPVAPPILRPEIRPGAPPVIQTVSGPKPAVALNPVKTVFPSETVDTNALAEKHEAEIQEHIEKLQELQVNDDAQSLQAILSELTSPDKEVREAAVEATIQFGSRDAIPVLKNLAAYTVDVDEQKALMDAAAFLELPTITEARAQNPDAKTQDAAPPQDPPSPPPQP